MLTFAELRAANSERSSQWHASGGSDEDWSESDWSNALMGEVGEVADALQALLLANGMTARFGRAADLVKKLRRRSIGIRGAKDPEVDVLRDEVGKELADAILYADLLANHLGIDLGEAIIAKFNEVSERQGFSQHISPVTGKLYHQRGGS